MIYVIIIILLIISYVYPYYWLILPWIAVLFLYSVKKENDTVRQERKVFNKLEIALNKTIIV